MRKIVSDEAGGGFIVDLAARLGLNIISRRTNMVPAAEALSHAIATGAIELSPSEELRRDLMDVRRVIQPGGNVRIELARTKRGHADMAAALLLIIGEALGYQRVKERRAAFNRRDIENRIRFPRFGGLEVPQRTGTPTIAEHELAGLLARGVDLSEREVRRAADLYEQNQEQQCSLRPKRPLKSLSKNSCTAHARQGETKTMSARNRAHRELESRNRWPPRQGRRQAAAAGDASSARRAPRDPAQRARGYASEVCETFKNPLPQRDAILDL